MDNLYAKIAEVLAVDSVADGDVLKSFSEWDSVSAIMLLAFVDKEFNARLTTNEIRACITVGDFVKLVQTKRKL